TALECPVGDPPGNLARRGAAGRGGRPGRPRADHELLYGHCGLVVLDQRVQHELHHTRGDLQRFHTEQFRPAARLDCQPQPYDADYRPGVYADDVCHRNPRAPNTSSSNVTGYMKTMP